MSLRHVTVASLLLAAAFSTHSTADAQEWRKANVHCDARESALSYLNITMQQFPLVQGVTHREQFAELFTDHLGNWTFVVTMGLETCIVASGTDLMGSPPPPEEGSGS